MIERLPITSYDKWLRWRRQDVTASAVGALFGCHPYQTALRLYCEKCGLEFPELDNRVMRRGRLMEPGAALAVEEERPEWKLIKADSYYRDPDKRIGATPDFLIAGDPRGPGVLQTKSIDPRVFERDWLDGERVPFWIVLQTLTEAMLTESTFGVVGGLVDDFDKTICIKEFSRHPASEARIIEAVRRFWDDVAAGREPDPDYGRDANLLPLIAPRERQSKALDLTGNNEVPSLLAERAYLCASIARSEARCKEIETELKFLMRDAECVTGLPGWNITFKTGTRAGYSVPAKEMRILRILDRRPKEEREQGDEHDRDARA